MRSPFPWTRRRAAIRDFKVTTSRGAGAEAIGIAFALPADIKAGTTRLSAVTPGFRSPALESDRMDELYDTEGNALGLEPGDAISFSGSIGDKQAHNVSPLIYADRMALAALLAKAKENFKLGEGMVLLNPVRSDDSIPDGAMTMRGYEGREWDLRDISIRSTDADNTKPSPNFFNANMNITTRQEAVDHKLGSCAFKAYDVAGMVRRLHVQFKPTSKPGTWKYTVRLDSGLSIPGVQEKTLEFDANGAVAGLRALHHIPVSTQDGTRFSNMELDMAALTQGGDSNTVAMVSQDGFPAGALEKVALSVDGTLSGSYANGKTRALFQLPLADFPNPAGLKQAGADTFRETAESGKPAVTRGPDPAGGAIRSGSLEYVTEEERARICAAHPGC